MRNSLNIEIEEAYKECVNCNCKFIDVKNNTQLCVVCDENWCLEKCKMCLEKFIKHKTVNDLYCLDCDEKITNCIDCKRDILKPSERCKDCERRFTNKLSVIKCQECNDEVEIKKDETWRKYCSDCFKNNLTYFNCIKCDEPFKRLTNDTWRKTCSNCYYKSK
jgi:hypothetical protein